MKKTIDKYTLRNVLELSTERYGDRLALTLIGDPDSGITYRKLRQMVDSMATYLIDKGIEKGDRVALLGESQPMWGVAYFAIISTGAVAVPILPDFSAKEVSTILEHSGAKALIVSSKVFDKCQAYTADGSHLLFRLDDLFHIPDPISTSLSNTNEFIHAPGRDTLRTKIDVKKIAEREMAEEDLASIIYTSGTTGTSKGVMLTNMNITSNANTSTTQFLKIKTGYRFLSILPLSHSYEFTLGFIVPMIIGGEIHYLGKAPAASILLPALKKIRPHMILSVPLLMEKIYRSSVAPQISKNPKISKLYGHAFMRKLINKMIGRKLKKTFGGKLKFFGVGGAALDNTVENFLKEAKFPYAIGYGLTETSPLLAGAGPSQTKSGSTGFALKGVTLRIAPPESGHGNGEIQAKGPNVMKGYYRNEELTKECFTEDGWFRTGDLGEITRGRVFIKGRLKTMILGPSGENIYPELIETLINNRPYVQESLVVPGDGGLAAMIKIDLELMAENLKVSVGEARDEAAQYLSKIREEVNKELSAFSRISDVSLQDEPFQRTPTMKIKRYLYTLKNSIVHRKPETSGNSPDNGKIHDVKGGSK